MEGKVETNQVINALKGKVTSIPIVDRTLTKEGHAADAKATGDAIAELKARINNFASAQNVAMTETEVSE